VFDCENIVYVWPSQEVGNDGDGKTERTLCFFCSLMDTLQVQLIGSMY